MEGGKTTLYLEYKIFLALCLLFAAAAFAFDGTADILRGLARIHTARGVMASDSIQIGGLGAAVVNSAFLGAYAVIILFAMRAKPTGAALMTLWMSAGWTFIGATVLNTLPLTLGVLLYARVKKRPFSDFMVPAVLCHTIAPITSKFYFSNPVMIHFEQEWHIIVNIACGILIGLLCGFILPAISVAAQRLHGGYTLYNMGVVGGMVALFLSSVYRVFGIDIERVASAYPGRNTEIAIFLFAIWAALIAIGIAGKGGIRPSVRNLRDLLDLSGFAPNDFYAYFGGSAYINMGLLGMIGTAMVLAFGAELNGIVLAAIYSMVAFGCAGKHIKNVLPLMAGCILCVLAARLNMTASMATILFSTCLAPIAGKYGWSGGMIAGFAHVAIVAHAGPLTLGMNLYNNGFASGFVAFFVVPILAEFTRRKRGEQQSP